MADNNLRVIRINQLKVLPEIAVDDKRLDAELRKKIKSILRLKNDGFTYKIAKKSVDSRKKPDIFIVYTVDVMPDCDMCRYDSNYLNNNHISKLVDGKNIMSTTIIKYNIPEPLRDRKRPSPVIVGFGPAGMFCALMLARAGYKPIVLERGEAVENRVKSVDGFWRGESLNENSNVQFGEGGAGTFSDGKLNTQIKEESGRIGKVLETFVQYGADKSILYEAKPHIGTDRLVGIVKGIRNEIMELGGQVLFNTRMTDVDIKNGKIASVYAAKTDSGDTIEIECDTLVLAIGHSSRDTFYAMSDKLVIEQKAFAVGLRIEHPQELINIYEFGEKYKNYMSASYSLTYKTKSGRGVYSFCMCPGGYVVNASSEKGRLAVNGMSYSARDGVNANAALIVTVDGRDYGSKEPLAGIGFQRRLEEAAYMAGGGHIPVQTFGDFARNMPTTDEKLMSYAVCPQTRGSYRAANLREVLPDALSTAIIEAVCYFGGRIAGYSDGGAVLSGVESRTSSPVRILRDNTLQARGLSGIYPCGEGAGYAGGITSAAVDGIKVYEAIVSKF